MEEAYSEFKKEIDFVLLVSKKDEIREKLLKHLNIVVILEN